MELWDIYDSNRKLTGKTIVRGEKLKKWEYHLVVHIWIVNSKGEFLIQKRAPSVKIRPNLWATTGGSAVKGDNSYTACVREMTEEIGIVPNMDNAKVLFTVTRDECISDIWLIKQDFPISDCKMQVEEVSDIRWASLEEIKKMIKEGTFWAYRYLDELMERINSI